MSKLNDQILQNCGDNKTNFRRVCFALTCTFIVYSMLLVTVPVHAINLGATPLILGIVFSTPFLLPLFLAIPLGGLVRRFGGRASLVCGAIAMTLAVTCMLLVEGYAGLILGQLLFGLAQLQMVLSAQTIISELGAGPKLERYFGWYTTWLSGGQIVGPLLAGALIHKGGTTSDSFFAMLVIGLCSLAGAMGLGGRAREGRRTDWRSIGFKAQGNLFATNSGVQLSIAVTGAATLAMIIHGNYLPVFLEDLAVPATTIGLLVSLRAVAAMAIRPFMAGAIALVGGRSTAVLGSVVLLAAGLMFLGGTDNLLLIALFAVMVGIGSGVCQPLSMVILAEHVDATRRLGALGMRLMANRGMNFLAPLLFGVVLELSGFGASFALAGGVLCGCLFLVWRLFRRPALSGSQKKAGE